MQQDNTPTTRRRLTDIITGGTDALRDQWQRTEAASDFVPLPTDTYTARVLSGELNTSKSGTPGYKLTLKVIEGEYTGRQFWHDVWLTSLAMPMAKRDLGKLGITDVDQLEQPLPMGIRCSVKLALRRDDDGTEYNRVRGFEVIGIDDDPTADDDFAPTADDDDKSEGTTESQIETTTAAEAGKVGPSVA